MMAMILIVSACSVHMVSTAPAHEAGDTLSGPPEHQLQRVLVGDDVICVQNLR